MMIFSLVAMIGLDKCCITSACLQWLCHSGERIVARGPLVFLYNLYIFVIEKFLCGLFYIALEEMLFVSIKYDDSILP